jgi:small-conductance mechanosensitive channel
LFCVLAFAVFSVIISIITVFYLFEKKRRNEKVSSPYSVLHFLIWMTGLSFIVAILATFSVLLSPLLTAILSSCVIVVLIYFSLRIMRISIEDEKSSPIYSS